MPKADIADTNALCMVACPMSNMMCIFVLSLVDARIDSVDPI